MPTLAEPEIVTRKGKPVSVILPIKNYLNARKTPMTRPGSNKLAENRYAIARSQIISQGKAQVACVIAGKCIGETSGASDHP